MVAPRFELPRVLLAQHAARLRISRARVRTEVRRGNWRPIVRGAVLTRPEAPTRADWAALGVALAGESAALSGWDALRVRGLGSAMPPSEEVLVLSRHASNRVIGRVRIRETDRDFLARYPSADAANYPLTPIVTVARAISDASRYYSALPPVRALVTSAVQRGACTLEQLVAELSNAPRAGSRLLRAALSDAMDGARSEAEAVAARRLAHEPIPPFELNVAVIDRRGRLVAVADVLWRELRAMLEIDSREFHFSEEQWKKTMARHNRLTRFGLAVTHYPPSVVSARGHGWLDETHDWLRDRAAELGVPWRPGGRVIRAANGEPAPFVLGGRDEP